MHRYKTQIHLYTILVFSILISSCIKEDRESCRYVNIGFDYSYNILSANAFGDQADQVTLYVFDKDGTLVMKEVSETTNLTNDYSISAMDLKTGKYTFVAWAQSTRITDEKAYFTIPDLTVGTSVLEDLSYYLKRTSGVQQYELNNLLIGITEAEIIDTQTAQNINIPLKKVNNKIRVVLLNYGGNSAIDVNDYTFSIVDKKGNGHLKYDYTLIEDEPITYHPYYTANSKPNSSETTSPNEINQAAIIEINTSRLAEANSPRLIITSNTDNTEIANINLPWFFSLTEMESHKGWTLQEYLDRQDEYAITLFLQGSSWMQEIIIINGWVINNISEDM